ncbi:MAG: UDP-N-acetylmuramoyl-L-alanine--D-glutamate ligase [Pseudomonadota bacterium]
MKFQDLRENNIVIWGAGRDGLSALGRLQQIFPEKPLTVYTDQKAPEDLMARFEKPGNVTFASGNHFIETLSAPDLVIKSPGISLYREEIKKAEKKGVYFISTTNLWFAEMGDKDIIAVTGTKGKSTTASILYHCLRKLGVSVELAGNIGTPLLDYLDRKDQTEIFVVELSSYQTADIRYTPKIAILVNLFPEHMDWHGSTDNYYKDKLHLFHPDPGRHTILNYKDKMTRNRTLGWDCVRYFEKEDLIHSRSNSIYYGATRLGAVKNAYLQGAHNLSNICAALSGLEAAGYDPETVMALLDNFVGLSHRQEVLGVKAGVLYVDDSISTIPESAIAAINRFSGPPVTILLGGFDREQRYEELARFLCSKNIHMVITLPDNGCRIAQLVRKEKETQGKGPNLIEADDLVSAVDAARRNTPDGGIVLLSPAAPSYGIFNNFEERGGIFRTAAGF